MNGVHLNYSYDLTSLHVKIYEIATALTYQNFISLSLTELKLTCSTSNGKKRQSEILIYEA